jgi:protein-disulfide isomerase
MDDNKPKEVVMADHKETVVKNRTKRATFWKVSTVVLLVLLILVIYSEGIPTGLSVAEDDEVIENSIAFINENLLMGMAEAELLDVSLDKGMYKLELSVEGSTGLIQEFTSYVTKDGNLLFPSAIDMSEYETIGETEEEELLPVEELVEVDTTNDPFVGPEDAAVTIVEFSDFECPFCSRAYETVNEVKELYGDDVKVVFKNFPLSFHDNAQKAAEASECAFDQDMFWEMHDMLFENQDALTVEDLKAYAEELGMDTETFNECLDSGAKEEAVEEDFNAGTEVGVTGTPAFFINGRELIGAQPLEAFQAIIDNELAPEEVVEEEPVEETEEEEEETEEIEEEEEETEEIEEEIVEEEPVEELTLTECVMFCATESFTGGACRAADEITGEICLEGETMYSFDQCEEGSFERCCCS